MNRVFMAKITDVQRRINTTSGNPRWSVSWGAGFGAITADDHAVAYDVTPDMVGGTYRLTLTNGKLTDAVRVDGTA